MNRLCTHSKRSMSLIKWDHTRDAYCNSGCTYTVKARQSKDTSLDTKHMCIRLTLAEALVMILFMWLLNFTLSSVVKPRSLIVFTTWCYASAVLAMGLCLSVYHKRRITQTTPHDSPGTVVFWCQRSPRNSTGVIPCGAPNAGGVGQNRQLSTNNWLYLENGTR